MPPTSSQVLADTPTNLRDAINLTSSVNTTGQACRARSSQRFQVNTTNCHAIGQLRSQNLTTDESGNKQDDVKYKNPPGSQFRRGILSYIARYKQSNASKFRLLDVQLREIHSLLSIVSFLKEMPHVIGVKNLLVQRLLAGVKKLRQRPDDVLRPWVDENGDGNPAAAPVGDDAVLDALVPPVAQDLEGVADVDDQGAGDRRDGDPGVVAAVYFADVQPADLVLEEEG
nr:hypothetical protein Iba_chr07cCG9620 [Ipomoea batatas]